MPAHPLIHSHRSTANDFSRSSNTEQQHRISHRTSTLSHRSRSQPLTPASSSAASRRRRLRPVAPSASLARSHSSSPTLELNLSIPGAPRPHRSVAACAWPQRWPTQRAFEPPSATHPGPTDRCAVSDRCNHRDHPACLRGRRLSITSLLSRMPPLDRTEAYSSASTRRFTGIRPAASSTAARRATSYRSASSSGTAWRVACARRGISYAATMASSLRRQALWWRQ